jgi:uncharacterized membrane protein
MADKQPGGDMSQAPPASPLRRGMSAQVEVALSVLLGAVAVVAVGQILSLPVSLLVGWGCRCRDLHDVDLGQHPADETARRATTTDPDRALTDLLVLTAAVASLVAIGFVLLKAARSEGAVELLQVGLALASVVLSWALVHTIHTLRYAHLYYTGHIGGIDFNYPDRPTYSEFAYLAFTIGMTFQVSDTVLKSRKIRRTALRHALLSYLFGTGILAVTVNLLASFRL